MAQIIDYAKEAATWDYDRFRSAVLDSSRKRGETEKTSLENKMAESLREAGIELDEFQENVDTCLAQGNFLLLIVGDRISPNIALLTKAIQSAPGLHFTIGLVEMQLYEVDQGQEWPLVVVPEVVGRTVNKTRGVVRVVYTQKPQVSIEMEDNDDSGFLATTKLDIDLFLKGVPKDLVEPFKDAVEGWRNMGGDIEFTNKMMHFTTELNGQAWRIIRCMAFQARLVTRDTFDCWSQDGLLWERYLKELEASPVVSNVIRSGKQWIRYKQLGPHDLRVALETGLALAGRVKAADVGE